MAEHISSFNIARGSMNSFYHIFRHKDHKAATIVKEHSKNNIYTTDNTVEEMLNMWKNDYQKYCDYKIENKHKGGKKIDKNNSLMEIVVNVKSTTTAEDMKEIEKYYEKELGIKIYGSAIHKDEGERDKDNNLERINHHAHIIGYTINDNKQMFRKQHITPKKLREMQTKTAEILQMERGQPASETKRKHKPHKQFKADVEKEKAIQAKLKAELEAELLEQLENKDVETIIEKCKDYAEKNKTVLGNIKIETLNKILNYVKKQTTFKYNFREMQKKITALENIDKEQKKELHKLNTQANKDTDKITTLNSQYDTYVLLHEEYKEKVDNKISEKTSKIADLENKVKELETKDNIDKNIVIDTKQQNKEKIDSSAKEKSYIPDYKSKKSNSSSYDRSR